MLYVTWMVLGSSPALADVGFGCGCNRDGPNTPEGHDSIPVCVSAPDGDDCETDDGTAGVCVDDECVTGGSGTASFTAAGGILLAAGLLVMRRRR